MAVLFPTVHHKVGILHSIFDQLASTKHYFGSPFIKHVLKNASYTKIFKEAYNLPLKVEQEMQFWGPLE